MQELQFARREDEALIVTNDAGEQFRIAIDEYLISEIKQVTRPQRTGPRVKPREIQAMIRAGKSRAEVVAVTGADESDVERHEGPVLAERQYIMDSALIVPVRAQGETSEETPQTFGAVIDDRLLGLGAERVEWTAWRDDSEGWMISLTFTSRDVDHQAIWTFEHKKSILAPLTSDAVTLSQQGDVGDRLIPKLRAVDSPGRAERFDSGVFDPTSLRADLASPADTELATTTPLPVERASVASTDSESNVEDASSPEAVASREGATRDDVSAETAYERRQEIDQRAISSHAEAPADLGQTADLLDALRRRRGERESARPERDSGADPLPRILNSAESNAAHEVKSASEQEPVSPTPEAAAASVTPLGSKRSAMPAPAPAADTNAGKKRRASIPSWDDILFGTRSEDDPA